MLIELFQQTPWWVYVLFVFLVLMGLRSTTHRTVPIKQLLIYPLVLTTLNFVWLNERLEGHYHDFFYWIIGLLLGAFFGWILFRHWKVHASHHFQTLALPPTWSSLILILLFFAIRYFFIFNYEMHTEAEFHLFVADSLISGAMTGIFIGRSSLLYWKYRKSISK